MQGSILRCRPALQRLCGDRAAVELTARIEKRESGPNADVENSGAALVYLSPGITWNLTRRLSAYAFVQAPLHQRVNGLQIEATRRASLGVHYIF